MNPASTPVTPASRNVLVPFSLPNLPLRGRLLRLEGLRTHVPTLPPSGECALALVELLAAAALLAHDAKHALTVSLQLQHAELGVLAFAQCSGEGGHGVLRAYANPAAQQTPFASLAKVPGGIFAVTLDPPDLSQRYQSLIALNQPTAAGCLADYFFHSVQTPTLLRVWAAGDQAYALMLQALPGQEIVPDDWTRMEALLGTVTLAEALDFALPPEDLLSKLFAEDDVTIFAAEVPTFAADDPRPRMLAALAGLPPAELRELMAQGTVTLTDQTTGASHSFTADELAHLLPGEAGVQ
jgi:molecular chaperone Hsp33